MKALLAILLLLPLACSRNGSGYNDIKPPPPPPPPVQFLISVESSAATANDFDTIESIVQGWRAELDRRQGLYHFIFFRSTESADGNYDWHPQGPQLGSGVAAADRIHQALQEIRAAPPGSAPQPFQTIVHGMFDARTQMVLGMQNIVVAFYAKDSGMFNASYQSYYQQIFDTEFGNGRWLALSVFSPNFATGTPLGFESFFLGDSATPGQLTDRIFGWLH